MDRLIFICPVCASPLSADGKTYRCINSHSYDISKEGYVNLLPANRKHSREPGDSNEMLNARKSFLDKGYYKQTAEAVTSIAVKYLHGRKPSPYTILDAGCGEGYYTGYISENEAIKKSSVIYGIDISKYGIRSASKRYRNIFFAVAGIYSLPAADKSVDIVLNIFAPFSEPGFSRILADDGLIISVTPGASHLYELKKNIYDDVYLNDEEFTLSGSLYISETVRVKYQVYLPSRDDISSLIRMTPYYHKSSPERIRSYIESAESLTTSVDFVIRVLKKV